MNFLVVHEDAALADGLQKTLSKAYETVVDVRSDFNGAIERLLEEENVDLIICENSKSNIKLFKYVASVEHGIPFILIEGDTTELAFPSLTMLAIVLRDGKSIVESVRDEVSAAIREKRLVAITDQDFLPVRTELLVRIVPLKADIYIKLSNIKFVKIFSKGDVFDIHDLERFIEEKEIHFFYLKQEDSHVFLGNLKKMLAKVLAASDVPPGDVPDLSQSIHEVSMKLGQELGFSETVQEMVKENVQLVIAGAKGTNIELLLKKTQGMQYLSTHSTLIAHIACGIAAQMGWKSKQSMEKLAYAALLHDVALKSDRLAKVTTLSELEECEENFSASEMESYRNHPQKGSEVARTFNEIPPDVDVMIAQHHERPDATGFPRKLSSQRIGAMSCLFIVAHDLVHAYFHKKQSLKEFVEEKRDFYETGNFKKVIAAVEAQAEHANEPSDSEEESPEQNENPSSDGKESAA